MARMANAIDVLPAMVIAEYFQIAKVESWGYVEQDSVRLTAAT